MADWRFKGFLQAKPIANFPVPFGTPSAPGRHGAPSDNDLLSAPENLAIS
jgi:hypothetical protein